jgi:soluble lytic murein transglycosylase-like protein
MKTSIFAAAILATAFLSARAFAPAITPTETYVRPAQPALTSEQQAWLGALEWCESGGNPKAINPKDSDGTPSYGLLQFKPSTYALFAKAYGLASTTNYMDASEQVAIVTGMIESGTVNFHHQFPACTGKLGTPPLST